MSSPNDEKLAKQLWAAGDIARLRIMRLLPRAESCKGGLNVSQLAEKLEMAQPTVSHHLRVLRQAGLVSFKKMCRDVYYQVDAGEIREVMNSLGRCLQTDSDGK